MSKRSGFKARRWLVSARIVLIAAAAAAGGGGCASESASVLLVTVRDAATRAPLAGAKVQADTAARSHPLPWAYEFGRSEPMRSIGFTDERGEARVEYHSGRPVRVGVLARGYSLVTEILDAPWLGPEEIAGPDESGQGVLSVRVEPAN